MLSAEGMSTRAIAPIVGVSHKTVVQDRNQLVPQVPVDEPRISHGLDGKSRTHQPRPEPAPEPTEPPKTVKGTVTSYTLVLPGHEKGAPGPLRRLWAYLTRPSSKTAINWYLRYQLMNRASRTGWTANPAPISPAPNQPPNPPNRPRR